MFYIVKVIDGNVGYWDGKGWASHHKEARPYYSNEWKVLVITALNLHAMIQPVVVEV